MRLDVLAQRDRVDAAEREARGRIRDEERASDDDGLVGVDDAVPRLLCADAGQQADDVGRVGVPDEPRAAGAEAVSTMAVKGARVRATAYAVGGVAPLSDEDVEKFFGRDDIAERRANLAQGR